MSFEALVADALAAKPNALAAAPTSAWMAHAAFVRATLATFLQHPLDWQRSEALQAVVQLPAGRAFVGLLLEPDSEHLALGLRLARLVGPDDDLEERLKELEQTETVIAALGIVDGVGTLEELEHWMGKPYTSPDVLESLRPALAALSRLAPRQLGRFAPRLVELIRNWESVDGLGSEEVASVYRALERANLSTMIAAFEPLMATDRTRWLQLVKTLYDQWPSGASWADNIIEYFQPSEDEEEGEADADETPPGQVEAFRRRR